MQSTVVYCLLCIWNFPSVSTVKSRLLFYSFKSVITVGFLQFHRSQRTTVATVSSLSTFNTTDSTNSTFYSFNCVNILRLLLSGANGEMWKAVYVKWFRYNILMEEIFLSSFQHFDCSKDYLLCNRSSLAACWRSWRKIRTSREPPQSIGWSVSATDGWFPRRPQYSAGGSRSGQVWEHTPEQRVAASSLWRYSLWRQTPGKFRPDQASVTFSMEQAKVEKKIGPPSVEAEGLEITWNLFFVRNQQNDWESLHCP